jgi:hypothetical protein
MAEHEGQIITNLQDGPSGGYITFDQILDQVRKKSSAQAHRYSGKELGIYGKNFIDIDNFLDVLYSLLNSNGYLLKVDDAPEPNKFIYTEEYPDIEANYNNTITFEIVKRAPASLSAQSDPFDGVKHYRPLYLGDEEDAKEGGRIIHLQSMYDNRIRFRCWSSKNEHARMLATLMESIISKYYYILRQYVPVIVYEGRGESRNSDKYGDHIFQGIPLDLFVRTNERVILREQEINCIEQNIQIG